MCDNSHTYSPPKLIPLVKWPSIHGAPSIGTLRHLVFFKKTNSFDSVLRYIGKRIYIDEAAFFEWVKRQSEKDLNK